LRHADLPATTFLIQPGRDTSVTTPAGTVLQIPAGALLPESGAIARLSVREAYTVGQLLRGGLTTVSGSDILSPAGAVGIEPGPGTKRKLAAPIRILFGGAAPTSVQQLWADTSKPARRVDWQESQQLAPGTAATVKSFGWYSPAVLIRDMEGFENSNLIAHFNGALQDGISVYLILPEEKILLEGGPSTSGAGAYAFYRNDGTVPLRPGKQGIVAGVKESGGQWQFAMQRFTAKASQTLQLELKPLSKAALEEQLRALH
jgi:hypothetical protein